jgi:hypothetical protein
MINAPNSLFYPGRHVGRFELTRRGSTGDPVSISRLNIIWESPIFSSFPSDRGLISSVGPLEESSAPLILTKAVQSIAHLIVFGPFPTKPTAPFAFHTMSFKERLYFERNDEDQCMRATAFFANALTRDEPEPGAFDFGLQPQCRESSVVAIQELISFYDLTAKVEAKAAEDEKWILLEAYDSVDSQLEWIEKDREWATLIADLAELKFIASSSRKLKSTEEVTYLDRSSRHFSDLVSVAEGIRSTTPARKQKSDTN